MDIVNYEHVPIKRIGKVITGKTPATSHEEYYGGQYMFISPVELHGGYRVTKSEKTITEKGLESIKTNSIEGISILVGCIGWDMGNVAMCFEKCATNQQINAITQIDAKYNPYYIYYWLCGKKKYLFSIASVTRTPILSKSTFEEIVIPLPIKKNQDKIANILLKIDQKITLNKQINDNLEQQAKLIYDYWFTQFDFPDENGKPYCSSGGKMVWNKKLKRNIPENWNVVPLLKLVSWESNSQPPKSEFVYEPKEGYVRFIQNRDYDSDTHITYIPQTKNLSIVDRFDILMDKYGDAGAVRYGIEGAFNVALGKICVHNPNYREYIRSFLGSDGIYKFLHNSCMASTRASLSEANLAILNVVVPDEKIILDYENFLHKIRVSILKNKDETVELINLRDWLLPMLMNGQATITD